MNVVTSLRLDEIRKLDAIARQYDTSRSGVIRMMLRFAIDNQATLRTWFDQTNGVTLNGDHG